jgi:hypothetical protein
MSVPLAPLPSFSSHARAVVRALREALSEVLGALRADPGDHQDVSRKLGLAKNLAWKVTKIIQEDDPAQALEQMPGGPGLRILLERIERSGVDPAMVEAARTAFTEYERLIELHSGDRATLEMMTGELSSSGNQQRDEQHRKLLFQGASYVWGVQAKVNLKLGIVGPGAEHGTLDFASVNGIFDFRRIRQDASWVMASRRSTNDDGTAMATSASESIDPRSNGPDQAALMLDYCSTPAPSMRRYVEGGSTHFELVEGPIGNTGLVTCVIGAIQRKIPYFRSKTNEFGEHTAISDLPSELLLMDVYFHKKFEFARNPERCLYSEMGAQVPYPGRGRNRHRLPLHEQLLDLGTDPLPVVTPEVPRYNQMVRGVFERLGWNPAEFFGVRMKIAYPACPTAVVLRYRLPEA